MLATPDARERFAVEVRTLDSLLEAERRVDLLKIDTEGAEVEVLAGAASTLRRTGRVVLEWHSPALRAAARTLLAEGGFDVVGSDGAIDYYRKADDVSTSGSTPG
ncbi:MAG: FkbM family methyltransferase [Chloroflexi bacterium]|nr:FkbM family methyltransferase [Chloroflexota bacterium]